jgi:peptidoglycan/xylan/chitin deacetylase (PgdA/CDA1 family)
MYHYVRDLPSTRYPNIKGMMIDDFRQQVAWLASNYELTTLEMTLAFLNGSYRPSKDLCVLTFDDGLKEHFTDVLPILLKHQVQGLFGVITSCVEDHVVSPVHMNHFLMAELGFEEYRSAFTRELQVTEPGELARARVDPIVAQKSYPLDTKEVATFKFFVNFTLNAYFCDKIIGRLFNKYLGDQKRFAQELYMSWEEIRQLQREGMLIAGHTHRHRPLSTLTKDELDEDLTVSRNLLNLNLKTQQFWPFSYPYGKRNSYSALAIGRIQELGFTCAFNTENGTNLTGSPIFELRRIDCNGAIQQLEA